MTHLRRMSWNAILFTPGDDIFSSVCAKKKNLADCHARVSHHELQAAQAEEERRLLQGQ